MIKTQIAEKYQKQQNNTGKPSDHPQKAVGAADLPDTLKKICSAKKSAQPVEITSGNMGKPSITGQLGRKSPVFLPYGKRFFVSGKVYR